MLKLRQQQNSILTSWPNSRIRVVEVHRRLGDGRMTETKFFSEISPDFFLTNQYACQPENISLNCEIWKAAAKVGSMKKLTTEFCEMLKQNFLSKQEIGILNDKSFTSNTSNLFNLFRLSGATCFGLQRPSSGPFVNRVFTIAGYILGSRYVYKLCQCACLLWVH